MDPEITLAEIKWLAPAVYADPTLIALAQIAVRGRNAYATDGYRLHYIQGTGLPDGFKLGATDLALILETAKHAPLVACAMTDGATTWHFTSGGADINMRFTISPNDLPEVEQYMTHRDAVELTAADLRKTYEREDLPDYCVIGEGWFSAKYVKEALRGAPKRVSVSLPADANAPVVFNYHNRYAVIMPMRKS